MILGQVELEWYHYTVGGVMATAYGITRIWVAVSDNRAKRELEKSKQEMEAKREENQTRFWERVTTAVERSAETQAEMNVKMDHVCKYPQKKI